MIPLVDSDPFFDPTGFWRKIQVLLIVAVIFAVLLLVGGILVLVRKKFARVLLGVGGAGTLASSIIVGIAIYRYMADGGWVTVNPAPTTLGLIGMAFNWHSCPAPHGGWHMAAFVGEMSIPFHTVGDRRILEGQSTVPSTAGCWTDAAAGDRSLSTLG